MTLWAYHAGQRALVCPNFANPKEQPLFFPTVLLRQHGWIVEDEKLERAVPRADPEASRIQLAPAGALNGLRRTH